MGQHRKNRRIEGEYDVKRAVSCVNGTFVGRSEDGVAAFLGIPFALPPTGGLRWKEPVPVTAREGVYEAFYNAPSPIQTEIASERASSGPQSEDCLYLNVWTAEGYEGQKRAVMVFIHGGSYGWGGTSDPLYDGHNFVKAHPEITLVTIAYRTGIMGFMDFSQVPGGEKYARSGNLGLLDQICALRYIRKNIAGFGGDPDRVTVFGESAGGGSVSLLPLIPEAGGLFSRIIAESGSVALTYSRGECLKLTRMLLKETGAKTMDELTVLPESRLKAVNEKLNPYNNFPERDGVVLPLDPYGAYERGEAFRADMMIGTNEDELRYWILDLGSLFKYRLTSHMMLAGLLMRLKPEDRKRVLAFLGSLPGRAVIDRPWKITEFFNELLFRLPAVRQAKAHAANGNKVYMYLWRYPSSIRDLGACHAVELAYVFNNLDETIYTGEGICVPLAETVQRMWVNFAMTGDPSAGDAVWKPYSERSDRTMLLDENCRMTSGLKKDQTRLLYPLTDCYINGNTTDMSPALPYVCLTAAAAAGIAAAALYKSAKKGNGRKRG